MTGTTNKLITRYYGFDFSIEDMRTPYEKPVAVSTVESASSRQWTKEVNLAPSVSRAPRLVFLAKSGKLFAHRGAA